jgi:hypothetical protein
MASTNNFFGDEDIAPSAVKAPAQAPLTLAQQQALLQKQDDRMATMRATANQAMQANNADTMRTSNLADTHHAGIDWGLVPAAAGTLAGIALTATGNPLMGVAAAKYGLDASGAQKAPAVKPVPTVQSSSGGAGGNVKDFSLQESITEQMARARQQGQALGAAGQQVNRNQTATANTYNRAGQGFSMGVPQVGGAATQVGAPPAPNLSNIGPGGGSGYAMEGLLGGAKTTRNPTGAAAPAAAPAAAAPGFSFGQRVAGQSFANPADINPNGLARPGQVAGQLGAGYQVGGVGDIQNGAAPGNVAGNLGTMGQSSQSQGNMLSRLEGFLDGPEGPSMAEAQLKQAQADNMGQLIGAARSGRGGAGSQAQALRGAMSEGSAVMSDTAGQLATLRAQEADMLKNRQLSAIGLGGEMSTAQRGQDLSYRGQDLSALQGDQGTQLGARGQDLSASMANQSTQTQLEQLRAQAAMQTRGQDLSALQGDQSAGVSMRNQDAGLLQGNQTTQLGARGQSLQQEANLNSINAQLRGQDLTGATSNADRVMAGQQMRLDAGLGYGKLANEATSQGLDYANSANNQGVILEGQAQDAANTYNTNWQSGINARQAPNASIFNTKTNAPMSPAEKLAWGVGGKVAEKGGEYAFDYLTK